MTRDDFDWRKRINSEVSDETDTTSRLYSTSHVDWWQRRSLGFIGEGSLVAMADGRGCMMVRWCSPATVGSAKLSTSFYGLLGNARRTRERERESGAAPVEACHGKLGARRRSDKVAAAEMAYGLYLGSNELDSGSRWKSGARRSYWLDESANGVAVAARELGEA
jgi:hypothetical protein